MAALNSGSVAATTDVAGSRRVAAPAEIAPDIPSDPAAAPSIHSDDSLDLKAADVRTVNRALRGLQDGATAEIANAAGQHAVVAGLTRDVAVTVRGHVGYYCAGMNQRARVDVLGNAGVGVAENMMSGRVHVHGDASQSAGATGRGGLLVIDGNAAARCGISMKGIDIVVGGSVGHMSAFMAQSGRLVVCGDAGDALGDSIYEAQLFVRGTVSSLGADCVEKPMAPSHHKALTLLLAEAGLPHATTEFRRYGSSRTLYHFHADHTGAY